MWTRRALIQFAFSAIVGLSVGCTQPEVTQPKDGDAGAKVEPARQSKVLKIAAVLPLTGPNASLGQEASNAARLAVKQWSEGNKIPGYTIEFVSEDDASDPKQAVAAAARVVGDPDVVAVVAHFNSGCLRAASGTYHNAGVMAVTPAATNPELTRQGYPEIARVCSNDNSQGMAAAEYLVKRGWKQIAIVHDKTPYGMGLAEVVKSESTSRGITIQSFDGVNVGDKDFKAILTKIKSQKPEVIYFGGLHEEAAFIVRQMKDLDLKSQFISDDGVYGQDFLKNAGPAGEGAIISFPSTPIDKLPSAMEFMSAYKANFNQEVMNWGPYGYDTATILLESVKKAVEDPAPGDLRKKVVAQVRSGDHKGILGDLKLDANGDPVNQRFSFYQVTAGKLEYLETIEKKAP